ncbi:hypothetical protein [Longispora albida]|uniref:LolA family protein n=1 Tax=Longispora albida TaxID=203523 RepID=UPI0003A530DB|nr:hypothetical protein [Longispora albida]
MGSMTKNKALRWAVPIGVVAVVSAVAGFSQLASAQPDLPKRSASQLLMDLEQARLDPLSGTIVQRADLGLPPMPGASSELSSMISGTHTLRIWYGGQDKVRLALLGTLGESDVIRNGKDLWIWSSQQNKATHYDVPADSKPSFTDPKELPKTPQEAADAILGALDPTTVVSTGGQVKVAGRPAYELILAPRDRASLVGSVRLAIDGDKHVPLRVQVFSKNAASPAFEVGFQQISFDKPGEEHFQFKPPAGVQNVPGKEDKEEEPGRRELEPKIVGTGWTSVLTAKVDVKKEAPGLLGSLGTQASGSWGTGRVISSKLFSVLITDDGRLFAGAVAPEKLYEVASK